MTKPNKSLYEEYLFIDSSDGVVINPNGLMSRKVVFENWGIKKATNT